MLTIDDIRAAEARLAGVARRTSVVTSASLDVAIGASVYVKAECFQRTGSFKFRGAYNAVAQVGGDAGVVAFSSGNHAQAVALAGRLCGLPAVIVMPHDAPDSKVEATRAYGAEIVRYDRYTEDRDEIARSLALDRGLELVPPFDDVRVMAGQGTAALELLDEVGELDALVVPVGGGGLIAGCATVAAALAPSCRVIGVEPEAGDDTKRSLATGERVRIDVPRTIADGQQVAIPGELTFPIVQRLVDEVVTVTDDQIVDAMRFLYERVKLVAEPSGATGVAALLSEAVHTPTSARVGVVLSGGNISASRFADLVTVA